MTILTKFAAALVCNGGFFEGGSTTAAPLPQPLAVRGADARTVEQVQCHIPAHPCTSLHFTTRPLDRPGVAAIKAAQRG